MRESPARPLRLTFGRETLILRELMHSLVMVNNKIVMNKNANPLAIISGVVLAKEFV